MRLLNEGEPIAGTYEVERYLGEGAFAEVYRVKHRFLGRQALKIFKTPGMSLDETETLLGEAVLLSKLGHPNIVRLFDAGILETPKGARGYFTMEYVAGGSLEQFWQSHGENFVPVDKTVEVAIQLLRGLSVAHDEEPPIVHRDIKPQNILVGYDPNGLRIRISDFGLARQVNPLTFLATARGTRCFKSPEALRDLSSDSCKGDVWAAGSTLYLLMTDRLPFPQLAEDLHANLDCFNEPVAPPSRYNIRVESALEGIVLRALAIDPSDRYPTAREMLRDLETWKPESTKKAKKPLEDSSSFVESKSALGQDASLSEQSASEMAAEAVRLARDSRSLAEASDLMEEAMNRWPEARDRYEYQLRLWRRGIAM